MSLTSASASDNGFGMTRIVGFMKANNYLIVQIHGLSPNKINGLSFRLILNPPSSPIRTDPYGIRPL